jgi:CubicO group peptidase (beta-lactamase class C family)
LLISYLREDNEFEKVDRSMRWAVSSIVGLVLLGTFVYFRPDRMIQISSGATSTIVCSMTFVSKQDPDAAYAENTRPEGGMIFIDWALRYKVDRVKRTVDTTVFGFFHSTARFHDRFGCVLDYGQTPPEHREPPASKRTNGEFAEPAEPVEPISAKLKAAIRNAFVEPEKGPRRWTKAVVILHHGKLVGEQYAPTFNPTTVIVSHSIAKSVTNALIGVLVHQGKLKIHDPVPIQEWTDSADPRHAITTDQLLRMSSGLPLDEGMGPGLAQRMWFTEPDNAGFAASVPLAAQPGAQWRYSNLGYALVARIIAKMTGPSQLQIAEFAKRDLFDPAGMTSALMEFDAKETPMGANAFYATARDWAKFGLLYLHDGVVGGRRILPEGWVAYSTKQTLDTGYGAGFWLNTTTTKIPVWGAQWGLPGAPKDTYFGRGYLGQFVIIVPSEDLVIVRMGVSHSGNGDVSGVGSLVHDIIDALHEIEP